ncbi:hypothetical protein QM806_25735 [Rhodococcus sp. IEGM 1351]|uniref:hypothetical protein n=1 Tax=Rhodococcus sp. IEGM 1351 TaxID=3047089 RepID=UPI0024B7BD85|nr:hypothetical protein [Rhodococcus sp. IEGM 1351]MDI9938793.1 hypothetical protein [Rhodococcus sp. IEGM 1351]
MARPAGNPVLAPIRRWVLYSRTNLTISVAAVLGVLFLAGTVFGEPPAPTRTPTTAATTDSTTTTAAPAANEITYDLVEVTESAIAGKTAAAVAKSAPSTAMAYAHSYVDISQSNTEWKTKLGRYTTDTPGDTIVAARPQVPVAITGPTTSEIVTGTGGNRRAEVTIPTQAGDLRVTVQVAESPNGTKWQVQNPFPTLDRDEVGKLGTSPSLVSDPAPASRTTTAPSTTTSATEPTASSDSEPSPPASSDSAPTPVPVPGPIPIPELDTPIPGAL